MMKIRYGHFVGAILGILMPAYTAQAFFFFIIPIPKKPSDPSKIIATLDQRQYSMCAAYHRNVIDPNTGGSRKTDFHGQMIEHILGQLNGFSTATKLIGTYVGQWQLQTKANYQGGLEYGKMLLAGCRSKSLPVSEQEFNVWNFGQGTDSTAQISATVASKPASLPIGVAPINEGAWLNATDVPVKLSRLARQKIMPVEIDISRTGQPRRCDVLESSGNVELDDLTCRLVISRARFRPANDGVDDIGSSYRYIADWKRAFTVMDSTSQVQAALVPAAPIDSVAERAKARCRDFGFKPGSLDFANCAVTQVQEINKERQQN